jgi:hypothetical protein
VRAPSGNGDVLPKLLTWRAEPGTPACSHLAHASLRADQWPMPAGLLTPEHNSVRMRWERLPCRSSGFCSKLGPVRLPRAAIAHASHAFRPDSIQCGPRRGTEKLLTSLREGLFRLRNQKSQFIRRILTARWFTNFHACSSSRFDATSGWG